MGSPFVDIHNRGSSSGLGSQPQCIKLTILTDRDVHCNGNMGYWTPIPNKQERKEEATSGT